MCGIFFSIVKSDCHRGNEDLKTRLKPLLDQRGPDSGVALYNEAPTSAGSFQLSWYSTVLSLRSDVVVAQPLVHDGSGATLCWNGEAWDITGKEVVGNDAQAVFDTLLGATNVEDILSQEEVDLRATQAIMTVCGPFAFVFFDRQRQSVYLGRDAIGRRSLLVRQDENCLTVSSVGDGQSGWSEVAADGVYVIRLSTDAASDHDRSINQLPLPTLVLLATYKAHNKYSIFNQVLPPNPVFFLDVNSPAVARLEALLRDALLVRTKTIPYCNSHASQGQGQTTSGITQSTPRVAILFSGGLDCTVLARLLHDTLPANEEIDLLNVAFHNPRSHGSTNADMLASFNLCPDRITARASHAELQAVCPDRTWRLVEINIPYEEMLNHKETVTQLMHPHDTEMDLSIALALYFAARGAGYYTAIDGTQIAYTAPARVLFSGLGADELFGGYQRHATAYSRHGYKGLLEELELDITRLGQRNLGRDDRVISHWGREARYPFLDEKLVRWAVTAPVWEKCGFGEVASTACVVDEEATASIEPGKKVLRLLAYKLGMVNVAREKKRAIQFGARTAKMDVGGGKKKGTHKIV